MEHRNSDGISRRRSVQEKTAIAYNDTEFGDFSARRQRTVIICHGFTDSGNSRWMNRVKDLLLEQVSPTSDENAQPLLSYFTTHRWVQ